jgi:hypothetical protein
MGSDVVIAKDETIVRAPLSAVAKVASFDKNVTELKKIKEIIYGRGEGS